VQRRKIIKVLKYTPGRGNYLGIPRLRLKLGKANINGEKAAKNLNAKKLSPPPTTKKKTRFNKAVGLFLKDCGKTFL